MMRPGAIVMTVLMVGVATGVYYGLDYLPDDVLPGKFRRASPDAAPPPPPGSLPATTTETAAAPAPEAAPAETPAPEAPAAEAPVDAEPQAMAAAPEPEPMPEPEPAAPAPEAPAEPAMTARAALPDEQPARPPVKKPPPQADAIKPWWPDPAKMPDGQLKLQYAGQVQGQQAIALLFSAPVNLASVRQHAEVRNSLGEATPGQWELGNNPRLAVFRGVVPGRYTVILSPTVADTGGYMLGTALQGPVYIQ